MSAAQRPVAQQMLQAYLDHFRTGPLPTHVPGDIALHKESQRLWITDLQPTVETNLGFIETYRDPLGVRFGLN